MTRKITGIFVILLLFLTAVSARGVHATPFGVNTEVYYETNLSDENMRNVLAEAYERFTRIEVFEPVMGRFFSKSGIDLKEDLFSWLGSNIRFGIVPVGGKPTLARQIRKLALYSRAKAELLQTVTILRYYRNAVEQFSMEHGRNPQNQREFEGIVEEKKLPRGGKVSYRAVEDGYELTVPANQFTDLGLAGNKPRYHSLDGFTGNVPAQEKKFKLTNYLLVMDVADSDKCRGFFQKIQGIFAEDESDRGITFTKKPHGSRLIWESSLFSYTFAGRQVMVSDNPGVLVEAFDILEKPYKQLPENPVYTDFSKTMPAGTGLAERLFVNIQLLDLKPELFNITNATWKDLLGDLYFLGYTGISNRQGLHYNIELIFHPNPKSHIVKDYFSTRSPQQGEIFENLPGGLSQALTYNIWDVWELIKIVARHEENLKEGTNLLRTQVEILTGMDLEKNIIGATSGQVTITYLIRDLFLSGLIDKNMEKLEETKASPMNMSRRMFRSMLRFDKIPVTFFVQIENREDFGKLTGMLEQKGDFQKTYYKGIPIYKSDKVAYCLTERLFIFHTFPSDISLRQYIDKVEIQRQRLSQETRYRDFSRDIKGRPLMISYHDSRWLSNLARGVILLVLPEFEDFADRYATFSENWGSLSAHPRGIQLRSVMYHQTER